MPLTLNVGSLPYRLRGLAHVPLFASRFSYLGVCPLSTVECSAEPQVAHPHPDQCTGHGGEGKDQS